MTEEHEHSADRDGRLADIRRTYAGYAASGRDRLWDPSNPGYARMATESRATIVELLCRSLPASGRVLDVGCGSGDLAAAVREVRPNVAWTGVDLLPNTVETARERYPWATWIEAAADGLPLEAQSFDVVVASTLFSSLPRGDLEDQAAAEIARVIRTGGWLVWYDLRYDNPNNRAVHGLDARRLSRLFSGWRPELRSLTLVLPLARRLGPATPVLYPLLAAIPLLRSHLVGRLQAP